MIFIVVLQKGKPMSESYFPCDIPYMSKKEIEENGIKIPKDKKQEQHEVIGCKGCKHLRSDNICKNDRCARMYKDRYERKREPMERKEAAMYWLNNLIGNYSDYYDDALEMGIKALEQQEDYAKQFRELQRARVLLKATLDLLKAAERNLYVEDVLSMLVHYDDADCDGSCLMEDIENYFYEFDAERENNE